MRKQYHFMPSERGLLAWDVDRLVALARDLPRSRVALSEIRELDSVYWFDDDEERPTCRRVVDHMRLVAAADLAWPIILGGDGRVMDGMHRVARALLEGHGTVEAVRFERDPEPDYVGVRPRDLPY
jgi:hypothetical protein